MPEESSIRNTLGIEPKGEAANPPEVEVEEPTPLMSPVVEEEPVSETPAEAVQEPVEVAEEAEAGAATPEGAEGAEEPNFKTRLKEMNARIAAASTEAAPQASPEVARLEGRVDELKARILEQGKEPVAAKERVGYEDVMESPLVQQAIAEAQDDPDKLARVAAVAASEAAKLEREAAQEPLKKQIEELRAGSEEARVAQLAAQKFQRGLILAAQQSEEAKALVENYVQSGYSPQTVVGALFKTRQDFLTSEDTMALGIERVAREMAGPAEARQVSRTAAGVRGKATLKGKTATEPETDESGEDEYDLYSKRETGRVNIPALAGQ